MVEEQKSEPLYKMVDIKGLSRALAENDWKVQTKCVPEEDLYELVASHVQGEGTEEGIRMEMQIKGHWATLMFDQIENYRKFIETYCKRE